MGRLLLLALFCLTAHSREVDVFGVTVAWEGTTTAVESQIASELSRLQTEGREFLDPDCKWRAKTSEGLCDNRFPEETARLDRLAEEFRLETLGFFNVRYEGGEKPRRDFGGIWQGYALQKIQEKVAGSWLVDISGDILVKKVDKPQKPLVITDPVFDAVAFAEVELSDGYMIASVSKKLGSKIQAPAGSTVDIHDQILKVVLFASPKFSGARLDAWATGVISGGKKVLDHLESLKEFRGQWAYFYFEPNGKVHCSTNIQCRSRKVLITFRDL